MHNDPTLDGKYLGTITQDFIQVCDNLKEASYQIRTRGFADYPIFLVSKFDISVGEVLIKSKEMNNDWTYSASYLGEFVQRGFVEQDRIEAFVSAYKNPDEFCCLFVVDEAFTKFIFIPFPVD